MPRYTQKGELLFEAAIDDNAVATIRAAVLMNGGHTKVCNPLGYAEVEHILNRITGEHELLDAFAELLRSMLDEYRDELRDERDKAADRFADLQDRVKTIERQGQ